MTDIYRSEIKIFSNLLHILYRHKTNQKIIYNPLDVKSMTSELVATIAILSAIAGTVFVTVKQWWSSTTPLNWNSLIKSIIIASFATVTTINLTNIPDPTTGATSWIGLVVTYLLIGSGTQLALGHSQSATAKQ